MSAEQIQADIKKLMAEDVIVMQRRLDSVRQQFETAVFSDDGMAAEKFRQEYLALIERRLDIYSSMIVLTRQLLAT